MAKKSEVNKSQAVREYLKANPKATNTEVSEALTKKGIKLTPNHVANIKTKAKAKRVVRKAKTAKLAAAVPAPPVVAAAPALAAPKAADTITLEQIKKVAETVKMIGGFARLHEMLSVIKEVGGLKKFKDLLDAMAVPGSDAIPF